MCIVCVGCVFLTENVALNKPAYLQYPFSPGNDQFDASNAVDGRKSDLSLNGGQCAVSEWGKASTWWVNLTSIHSIHHITIHFRTENHGIATIIRYLGNDSLCGKNCHHTFTFLIYMITFRFYKISKSWYDFPCYFERCNTEQMLLVSV